MFPNRSPPHCNDLPWTRERHQNKNQTAPVPQWFLRARRNVVQHCETRSQNRLLVSVGENSDNLDWSRSPHPNWAHAELPRARLQSLCGTNICEKGINQTRCTQGLPVGIV